MATQAQVRRLLSPWKTVTLKPSLRERMDEAKDRIHIPDSFGGVRKTYEVVDSAQRRGVVGDVVLYKFTPKDLGFKGTQYTNTVMDFAKSLGYRACPVATAMELALIVDTKELLANNPFYFPIEERWCDVALISTRVFLHEDTVGVSATITSIARMWDPSAQLVFTR